MPLCTRVYAVVAHTHENGKESGKSLVVTLSEQDGRVLVKSTATADDVHETPSLIFDRTNAVEAKLRIKASREWACNVGCGDLILQDLDPKAQTVASLNEFKASAVALERGGSVSF